MALSDDLAEAIGQVAINAIIESGLVSVGDSDGQRVPGDYVSVWSANAAEQIGQTVLQRFKVEMNESVS